MSNMIQAARDQIAALTQAAYEKAAAAGQLPAGQQIQGRVEIPKDVKNGDYASSFAMAGAKALHQSPRAIAQTLMDNLDLTGSYFSSVEIAGPGFLNFRLGDKWYGDVLADIESEGGTYGKVDMGKGQKVMVEFVSANPTGTMTIGNARGGVLGDSMASVLERAGYNVWREFYVNDAGNQVMRFGKSLNARYLQAMKVENAPDVPEDGYHGEDVVKLGQVAAERFGDTLLSLPEESRVEQLREFGIAYNIEKMQADLNRYGITYDKWFLESTLHKSGYVDETMQLLQDGGWVYEKDGALWFKLTELGHDKDEVLKRSTGGWTYFAVDIAYHRNKFEERHFDKVIDVLGADHHGHALRFKAGIQALGIDSSKLDFLIMQLVQLMQDGREVKVSKRSGRAITLSDLLDEIPVDAARYHFNAKPTSHLLFDMDLAIREDSDNPVYYIQYAHARICSLVRALAEEGQTVPAAAAVDPALLSTDADHALIKSLSQLPEEIRLAARDYDPSRINRYLAALAGDFHRFYNANRIKGEAPALVAARLKLADTTRSVLANAMGILGIHAPEKM